MDGPAALYSLLTEDTRRTATLSVLARWLDSQNFREMLEVLQYEGGLGRGAAAPKPAMQAELLRTLNQMLQSGAQRGEMAAENVPLVLGDGSSGGAAVGVGKEESVKDIFREIGGFECIFSVLARLDGVFVSESGATLAAV